MSYVVSIYSTLKNNNHMDKLIEFPFRILMYLFINVKQKLMDLLNMYKINHSNLITHFVKVNLRV